MCDEALVTWVKSSVHGDHGVFHAIRGICTNDFWVIVHSEISTVSGDNFGGELGGLLPASGVVFLGDRDAFYAIPFYLTDAISGVGGPSEVVDIIGMKLPAFAFSGCGDNDRGLRADGCFFEVRNIYLLSQGCWHGFGFVLKRACGFHDIVIGQVQFHVKSTVIAVKFLLYVLVGFPSKLSIIHANSWIPMHPVEVFIAMVVVHFHSSAHTTTIKIGCKIDIKVDAFTAF